MESQRFDRLARLMAAAANRRQGIAAVMGAALSSSVFGAAEAGKQQGAKPAGPCGNGSVKDNRCTKDSQCCTRICDLKLSKKNKDKRGRCRCLKNGKPCKVDQNCCTTSVCFEGACVTCRKENQTCANSGDCCGGNYCIAGVCKPCRPENASCSSASECCDGFNCLNGACTECVAVDAPCASSAECCSGAVCREGACTLPATVKTGEPCRVEFDTCQNPDATCTTYEFEEPEGTYCLLPRKAHCGSDMECVSRDCPGDICVACSLPVCLTPCNPVVCKGNACTFKTIQLAIDAAADGTVIDIGAGEYQEDLVISKNITLRACKRQPVTIQNKTYDTRTITVTGDYSVALIDITVEALADLDSNKFGGGIYTRGDLGLFRFSVVRNGVWPIGGGIFAGDWVIDGLDRTTAPATVKNGGEVDIFVVDQSVVEDNTAIIAGGGIFAGWGGEEYNGLKNAAAADAPGTRARANRRSFGAAADREESNYDFSVTVAGSAVIKDNTVQGIKLKSGVIGTQNSLPISGGGGVWVGNGWVEMYDDSLMQNNRVTNGGGGAMLVFPCPCEYSVYMGDSARCFRNRAKAAGGVAILNEYGSVPFAGLWMEDDAAIAENRVDSYGGGAVLNGVALWMDDDAAISRNISLGDVGGAVVSGFNPGEDSYNAIMADNATIANNTAVDECGGLALDGVWGLLQGSASITRNVAAHDGGGVYLSVADDSPYWNSGIVLNDDSSITLNVAANDDTGSGGGIFSDAVGNEVYGGDRITNNSPDNCVGSTSPNCVA